MGNNDTLNILLADDDKDDCQLFKEALEELDLNASLIIVYEGEQLMQHLETVSANLPLVLFLDLNMPRKNGFECLTEIKNSSTLKNLPVIVISTFYDEEKASQLYNMGANHIIRKPSDFEDLKNVVHKAIMLINQNAERPSRNKFLIQKLTTAL